MIGAIVGDIVGSVFEFSNIHTKNFKLFERDSSPTDDSVMTIAVADAILQWEDEGEREKNNYKRLSELAIEKMQYWGLKYPHAGYGGHFIQWLADKHPQPYNSCGNGSAMRISPVGWAAYDLEDCIAMSKAVTEISHNHPDGIMGAEATAVQIFQAKGGANLRELEQYEDTHYYKMEVGMDWLRKNYKWHSLCDGTCQAAYTCLYESADFEDAIRNCMCIGGDCDTTGAS